MNFIKEKDGSICPRVENVRMAIEHEVAPQDMYYDEYIGRHVIRNAPWHKYIDPEWPIDAYDMADMAAIMFWFADKYATNHTRFQRPNKAYKEMLFGLCAQRRRNTLHEKLTRPWDKKDRFKGARFGGDNTPENDAMIRRFLIGAVRRAFEPGCPLDSILVLSGPKYGKSTAAEILGKGVKITIPDPWRTWLLLEPGRLSTAMLSTMCYRGTESWLKDSFLPTIPERILTEPWHRYRRWITEIQFCDKGFTEKQKEYLFQTTDTYRGVVYPRAGAYIGTTLQRIKSSPGIDVLSLTQTIDTVWISRNIKQIWAQAVYEYQQQKAIQYGLSE
jgi:predicted P-loop ATPase